MSRQYLFLRLSKKARKGRLGVLKFRAEPLYPPLSPHEKLVLAVLHVFSIVSTHCHRTSSSKYLSLSYPKEFRANVRTVSAPIEKASISFDSLSLSRERVSVIRRPFSRTGNRRPGIEINLYSALKGEGEGSSVPGTERSIDRGK